MQQRRSTQWRQWMWAAGLVAGLAVCGAAHAQQATSAPAGPGTTYSDAGADTCLGCHDPDSDTPPFQTAAIFRTPHAQRHDARTPFGPKGLQCEACHGPGAAHATQGSNKKATINSQKADSFMTPAQRNAPCLSCHQGDARTGWHSGAHDRGDVACSDCHRMHATRDPVRTTATQPAVCYRCHAAQRAEFEKTSVHPVRFGRMACSDCHNPHGSSSGRAMLVRAPLNETCYACHADKRGPVLWEHAPVVEDCSQCHTPHGSVRPSLLTQSPPLLCQQCHAPAGHPSVPRTASGLPGQGGGGSIFLVAGSCTNCHSQVHGSNHPAGAKLMR
jgi:DmsE family decaheme c-type cytochrome